MRRFPAGKDAHISERGDAQISGALTDSTTSAARAVGSLRGLAEIGSTLREARIRGQVDLNEVESRTKIRARYLRAMEHEEWDKLPGTVYAKSFLRTYADYLGLDAGALVDEFKRRYERPTDYELRPMSPLPRDDEPDRESATRYRPRMPSWAPVALVLVAVVALLYVVGTRGQKHGATPTNAHANRQLKHHAHAPHRRITASDSGANHTTPVSTVPGALASLAPLGKLKPPGAPGTVGPEGVPIPDAPQLAGGDHKSAGAAVDDIQCQGAEQVRFHIQAHLTVFVDGTARRVPSGIGISRAQVSPAPLGPYVAAGSCFYWLHTHAADGIIHIESPVQRTYTLGNFFDLWGQRLTPNGVGPVSGPVTALYNGQVFRGNPRDIPVTKHAQIQLEVGRPLVAPVAISFPASAGG